MEFKKMLLAFFFPERCPFCEELIETDEIACEKCLRQLTEKQRPIIRGALGYRCVSSFIYDGKVRRMLIRVKYYQRVQHIRRIAGIMAKDIRECYAAIPFDMITYVPMHIKDEKHRGYNQSEMLAHELGQILGIPVTETLAKIKRTEKQHHLSYAKRKTNLRGAFRAVDPAALKDKTILIADDIVTSGYTLGTCCKELNKGHPRLIVCATAANAQTVVDESAVI